MKTLVVCGCLILSTTGRKEIILFTGPHLTAEMILEIKEFSILGRRILMKSDSVTGEYTRVEAFDRSIAVLEAGLYEAPTAFQTSDGRWCLMLDYYGCSAEGQGYVPFLADSG